MARFDPGAYDAFLIEHGAVGFFFPPITLKSGRPGFYYINMRDLLRNLETKQVLARFVYDFAVDNNIKPAYFLGIPEGATPIGEAVTALIDYLPKDQIPAAVLRTKPKGHGDPKDRFSVGPLNYQQLAAAVEDVTTTGESTITQLIIMQEAGIPIKDDISMATREERRNRGRSVPEVLKKDFNVNLYAMTSASRILPKVFQQKFRGRKADEPEIVALIKNIHDYSKKYGEVEIDLSGVDLSEPATA
jgi:orotate phosphoribosyltransferase